MAAAACAAWSRWGALEGRAADPNRYYTLQPLFESGADHTPVDSGVFMRPAMTRNRPRS